MTDNPKARPKKPGGDQAIEELLAELALTSIDRQRFAAGKYGVAGRWVFDRGLATVKAANDAEDDR